MKTYRGKMLIQESFNRTKVGLKFGVDTEDNSKGSGFNRTKVGLKSVLSLCGLALLSVLIELR